MASGFRLLLVVFSRLAFQISLTACPENQSRSAGADIKNAVRVLDGVGLLRGCGFETLSVNRTTLFQKAVIKGRCYNKPYRSIRVRAILSFLNGALLYRPASLRRYARSARLAPECPHIPASCVADAPYKGPAALCAACAAIPMRMIGKAIKNLLIFYGPCRIISGDKNWAADKIARDDPCHT